MKNLTITILSLMLLLSSVATEADIALDIKDGRPLVVIIQNATAADMTIDDVVTQIIKAIPERAGDAIAAAILLMPTMPPSACHVEAPEKEDEWTWRTACEKMVIQAAQDAGAEPAVIAAATASIRLPTLPPKRAEFSLGPTRRYAPVQVPNGGAGGGGIASPS